MNACKSTYASLRIEKADIDLLDVSAAIGLEPTHVAPETAEATRWIFCTQDAVKSDDLDDHIKAITECLMRRGVRAVRDLQNQGHKIDIFCYWLSRTGHGGAEIKADTLLELGCLGIKLGIDFYGSGGAAK